MARDGSGTHSLPQAAFVSGTTIESAKVNSNFSDISSSLTASLAKDGQTVPTANLPMGGFKHTGVADGSSRTDYASLGQVAKGTLFYAADTGAADAYAVAPSPGIAANVVGFSVDWKVTNANLTTTPTLAANSLTAGTIVWPNGSALAAGDLPAGALVTTKIASLSGSTPTWHLMTVARPGFVAGILPFSPPQGRLTLTTATPVPTANVTAATAIYYAPYCGNVIPIYNGTNLIPTVFSELTNTTTDNTKNPAAVTTNSNYDLFVWNDAGTIRLGRGPAWTSDTGRGTGAGTTELERVNGLLVNKIAISNGPAAQRGTYVGTVRSDGSSQINWHVGAVAANGTAALLCVWNAYNRVLVGGLIGDTTDSWNYSTVTTRPSNNSTTMRVSFVQGLQEEIFEGEFANQYTNGSQQTLAYAGIGYDSTTAFSGRFSGNANPVGVGSGIFTSAGSHRVQALGFHYMQALELPNNTGTTTWYGDAGGVSQNGLSYLGRF